MFTTYSAQFVTAFEDIVQKIACLNSHIKTKLIQLPLWIDNGANEFEANTAKLISALANFRPTEGLSAQETFKCPGVVACTTKTSDLIDHVNTAKNTFKLLIRECREENTQDVSKFVRKILANAGYPCVKLKQVLRCIPFINYHPRRIAWTKGKHTTSKLLPKKILQELLIKAGQGQHIDIQIKKLNTLDNKVKLVKHRDIKPGWVINVGSFKDKTNNRSKYEDIRTALPLFYIHDKRLPNPIVCFAKPGSKTRKGRVDKLIDPIPFLPSISVYRYKSTKKTNLNVWSCRTD